MNTPRDENNCIDPEKMEIYINIFILNNLLFTEDETKKLSRDTNGFFALFLMFLF